MGSSNHKLGSRARAVLQLLAERPGRTVTKTEILDGAWAGLVVEENNISVQIATLRKALGAEAIETIPGIGYRLSASIAPAAVVLLRNEAARPATVSVARPPTSELIGRSDDIQTLIAVTRTESLVSIVGPGGVGKTSVARELAEHLRVEGREVHWIDLSPLTDGSQLTALVASALSTEADGEDSLAMLFEAAADSQATIVLDNCEHLLAAVAHLVGIARRHAPGIGWIATSQENLHLSFEAVYRLEPLALPAIQGSAEDAMRSASVELMCRRVGAMDRHFRMTSSNVEAIVELCRGLEGLPLAIEIAAAHVASLGIDAVREQLRDRLWLPSKSKLAVGRHHSLLAVCQWSYGLLSAEERAVFRRIAPFANGFTMTMAQQLVSSDFASPPRIDTAAVAGHLSALVDKCVLQRTESTPSRFSLLETTRDFALERLREGGEEATAFGCHAEIVATWFEPSRRDREHLTDSQWDARYTRERFNVRSALLHACSSGDSDLIARLTAALARIDWVTRETVEILRLNVPVPAILAAASPVRAEACLELSWSHHFEGHRETGTDLAARAVVDFQALGDEAGAYRAQAQLVRLCESRRSMRSRALAEWDHFLRMDASRIPRYTRLFCALSAGLQYEGSPSPERYERMESECQRAGFTSLAAICRLQVTDELLGLGRYEEAVDRTTEYLASGECRPRVAGFLLTNQILALIRLGRTDEAYEPALRAARYLPRLTHIIVTPFCLALAASSRDEDACILTGFAEEARKRRDEIPDPSEAEAAREANALLVQRLAPDRYGELMAIGAAMTSAEVMAVLTHRASVPTRSLPPTDVAARDRAGRGS